MPVVHSCSISRRRTWSERLCEVFGVPSPTLPDVVGVQHARHHHRWAAHRRPRGCRAGRLARRHGTPTAIRTSGGASRPRTERAVRSWRSPKVSAVPLDKKMVETLAWQLGTNGSRSRATPATGETVKWMAEVLGQHPERASRARCQCHTPSGVDGRAGVLGLGAVVGPVGAAG